MDRLQKALFHARRAHANARYLAIAAQQDAATFAASAMFLTNETSELAIAIAEIESMIDCQQEEDVHGM